jgi:23S rRNA pseudouridine2457 synthase
MASDHRYFILNKPYGMESQFISPYEGPLLGDLAFEFPDATHAIGRLDKYSEGLLLLTTNKKITRLLFQSQVPHKRIYVVQVRHQMSEGTLEQLRQGVPIRISGDTYYTTPPCEVQWGSAPPFPSPRLFPEYVESSWVQLTLTEGKFRQVRKMMAAVRHRVMRLVRTSIEDVRLDDLAPGSVRELDEYAFFSLLKLDTASLHL